MAKLHFRYGAMNSSKTANALMTYFNFNERGKWVLLAKPVLENRDGSNIIKSRCGLQEQCVFVEDLRDEIVKGYHTIIVDEAHFLTKEDIAKFVKWVDEYRVNVICYGLRADFRNELFEGSKWLLAWADDIDEILTVCECGRKATVNARIVDGKVSKEGEQVQLGGNELYTSMCRQCYNREAK